MRVGAVTLVFLCGAVFLEMLHEMNFQLSPLGGSLAFGQAAQAEVQLARILTDGQLWGEDAFAVFGSLDRWKNAGEASIVIYLDRVASGSRWDTPEPARQGVGRMAAAMQRPRPQLRPEYASRYSGPIAARAPALKVESARFLEDDSFRVVWQREGGEFLKKGLTARAVLATYGKPEKTTTEVVHSRGDRRPAVLTIHHYANDTVRFVESDLAPTPGLVDRVVLDVGAAAAQIFVSAP